MTKRDALTKLKELSEDLENVDYDYIFSLFKDSIRKIPVPVAKLHNNTAIDRVRKNIGEDFFSNVHGQLSYIKDPYVVEHFMKEFGRANLPHQPMFYGAIESSLIGHQRVTALAETSNLLKDPEGVNFEGELYTVSRWRNNEELFLAEMVFSQEAIDTNPDIKRNFENQKKFAQEHGEDDVDFFIELLIFISDQFAREPKTHSCYKISCAYTNLVLSKGSIHGVAYPSVRTKYQGQNIVLPPWVVDRYLNIDVLAMQRVYKNKMRSVVGNGKNCQNPNDCLENLVWADLPPELIAPKEHIIDSLNGNDEILFK